MRTLKESGIDWIGKIPSEWKICQLKQMYEIRHGVSSAMKMFSQEGTHLCLTTSDIKWSGIDISGIRKIAFISKESGSLLALKRGHLLRYADALISGMGSAIGTTCMYYDEIAPCYADKSIYIGRSTQNNTKFLYYWMYAVVSAGYIKTFSSKVTRKSISLTQVNTIPIVNLPRKEQDDIVSFLDDKCPAIDAAIERKSKLQKKLEEYKKVLIEKSVLQGINPDARMKDSDVEWIGNIPSHWKIGKGKNLFTQRKSKGNEIKLQMLSASCNKGIIPQEECIKGNKSVKRLTVNNDLTKHPTIHKNDFCISLGSYTDGIFCSDHEGVVSDEYKIFYISSNDAYIGYYRYMFICDAFIKKIASYTSTCRKGKAISYVDFADTPICLPPIEEQKEIAEFLDNKCAILDKAIENTKESIEKLEEYKKSFVYHVVTGKIDCRKQED